MTKVGIVSRSTLFIAEEWEQFIDNSMEASHLLD